MISLARVVVKAPTYAHSRIAGAPHHFNRARGTCYGASTSFTELSTNSTLRNKSKTRKIAQPAKVAWKWITVLELAQETWWHCSCSIFWTLSLHCSQFSKYPKLYYQTTTMDHMTIYTRELSDLTASVCLSVAKTISNDSSTVTQCHPMKRNPQQRVRRIFFTSILATIPEEDDNNQPRRKSSSKLRNVAARSAWSPCGTIAWVYRLYDARESPLCR